MNRRDLSELDPEPQRSLEPPGGNFFRKNDLVDVVRGMIPRCEADFCFTKLSEGRFKIKIELSPLLYEISKKGKFPWCT